MKKRICLFAGYDSNGLVHEHVVHYVAQLANFSDVYYLADCEISEKELSKLSQFTVLSLAYRHEMYDFGSWKLLMDRIGADLCNYDEMILANDSCFGPIHPFLPIFEEMDAKNLDFWGLTDNDMLGRHLQSFFLVFSRNVFLSDHFIRFFDNVKKEPSVQEVINNYEVKLTNYLYAAGFSWGVYVHSDVLNNSLLNKTTYPFTLMSKSLPLIKVKNFTSIDFSKECLFNWKRKISSCSDYPTQLIEIFLEKKGVPFFFLNHFLYLMKFNVVRFVRNYSPQIVVDVVKFVKTKPIGSERNK